MAKYCKSCFKKLPRGHAGKKALAGGLLFGSVGAIAGGASGISHDINSSDLCLTCQMNKAHKRNRDISDQKRQIERARLDAEMQQIEMKGEMEKDRRQREKHHKEMMEKIDADPLKILKIRYANGEITKKEFEDTKKDLDG